jgi:hypothetical protein
MVFQDSRCTFKFPYCSHFRADRMDFLISLLHIFPGDRSNGADGGRCLPLVHGRLRRHESPQKLQFLPDRQSDDRCSHLADCSGIFCLPHLDVEQADLVSLSVHCCRTYPSGHFSTYPVAAIIDILYSHQARHSTSCWGCLGRYQGEYRLIRISTLCIT